jgi:hypothetical protein
VEHLFDEFDRRCEAVDWISGALTASDNRSIVADGTHGYFCPANVDSSKHPEVTLDLLLVSVSCGEAL